MWVLPCYWRACPWDFTRVFTGFSPMLTHYNNNISSIYIRASGMYFSSPPPSPPLLQAGVCRQLSSSFSLGSGKMMSSTSRTTLLTSPTPTTLSSSSSFPRGLTFHLPTRPRARNTLRSTTCQNLNTCSILVPRGLHSVSMNF